MPTGTSKGYLKYIKDTSGRFWANTMDDKLRFQITERQNPDDISNGFLFNATKNGSSVVMSSVQDGRPVITWRQHSHLCAPLGYSAGKVQTVPEMVAGYPTE